MVCLGLWQLDRYHERSAINDRIDAGAAGPATPLASVMARPGAPAGAAGGEVVGHAGAAPPASAAWTRVTATGRYDPANQILVRGRSVNGRVGFEVVTPLVFADGSAVLVDRGWVPPAPDAGAVAMPEVPAPPAGPVTVEGRLHLTESRPGRVDRRDGWIETRRISVPRLADELPYEVYGAYVLMDSQQPAADERLVPVPVAHQKSWMNAGYVVQWWMFAALTLAGLVWLARREAHGPAQPAPAAIVQR